MADLNPQSPDLTQPHRGFIYFCEATLSYTKGPKAWLFFAPYLTGAVLLEPGLDWKNTNPHDLWKWGVLLIYLIIFPVLWRAVLLRTGLWPKRSEPVSKSI